jgi:hypothetical protein
MKQKSPRVAKLRNYLARHPLLRKGGAHEKPRKAERRLQKQSLHRSPYAT